MLVVQPSKKTFFRTFKTKWLLLRDKRYALEAKTSNNICLLLMFQCDIIYTSSLILYMMAEFRGGGFSLQKLCQVPDSNRGPPG